MRAGSVLALAVAALAALAACAAGGAQGSHPVTLDVQFTLTDLDDKPLPGVPVRLVFGDRPDGQNADAGVRFVTDNAGQHRFSTATTLERVAKKRPTNFVSSLVSRAEATEHLSLGAELPYFAYRWLYVVDLFRFEDGDVLNDGLSVYTRASDGLFTNKAVVKDGSWQMADLGGLLLTTPGHDVSDFSLQPVDGAGDRWTLKLGFRKSPEPIRR